MVLTSCNPHKSQLSDGYVLYQTFDEYSMKGVNSNDEKPQKPYVAIIKNDSAITVRICYSNGKEKDKYIYYQNKGGYWYSIIKDQVDPKLYFTTLCDTVPFYTERYFYNDTIMEYSYYLRNGHKKSLEQLVFKTRNSMVEFNLSTTFRIRQNKKFEDLKHEIIDYKEKYPYDDRELAHRDKNYIFYKKVLQGDSIFLYENDGKMNYKLGCLKDIRICNSLGEFDPNKSENIALVKNMRVICK
ncbi:hypothetical protein [Bacteroides luti]|nr:hypothetical protein [Bacteroides luti]